MELKKVYKVFFLDGDKWHSLPLSKTYSDKKAAKKELEEKRKEGGYKFKIMSRFVSAWVEEI